ncbi:TonB-dependent receptor [Teredinibacter turnerae]|uniref:TonB-dependent receptor n=1 Tax=Teredinibacter turnerae TaxID=2426 RepID=UPI0005F7FCFD|nr:TonB-dependent receptor [Teredinibacter turnerae]
MFRGNSKPPFAPNALAAMITAFTTGSALAQDNADLNYRMTEEELVVVGTQKRDQDMMEVPIAVDALGPTDLKETGALMLGEIADYTPGFKFSKDDVVQGGATMRGITSSNISTGGDPSVAVFFDDVYMPRAAQSVPFADIERIEILKGPQGTLFGKNAAAGVVHIVPNAPKMEREGFASVRLGDYGLLRGEAMLNIPINGAAAFRINALSDQRDSYIENVNQDYEGEELGNRNQKAARASFLMDLSSATRVQFAVDWNDLDQGYKANIGVSPYAYNIDPGSRKMASDVEDGHETRDMTGYSVKLNHEFSDEWSAKLVTSFRDWEVSGRDDTDGTADATRYVDTVNYENSDIFYNELQFNFATSKLNAVGGVTYSVEDIYQKTSINVTADTVARLTTQGINDQLVGGLQAAGASEEEIAA